jgi:hypothetical protein
MYYVHKNFIGENADEIPSEFDDKNCGLWTWWIFVDKNAVSVRILFL